jgi:hypothetical protein
VIRNPVISPDCRICMAASPRRIGRLPSLESLSAMTSFKFPESWNRHRPIPHSLVGGNRET